MENAVKLALQTLAWKDAREKVHTVNPELATLIDELNPGPELRLYSCRYPFGANVLKNGEFFLPTTNGELISFNDPRIDSQIKADLGYNHDSNPVSLVLSKTFDMHIMLEDRIIPFFLFQEGRVFGLWRFLDEIAQGGSFHVPVFTWDMTAGARSVFMLPKISEAIAHGKLKQAMRVTIDKPNSMLDHWKVFRAIAQQPHFSEPWDADILYFSVAWIEKLNDPAWIKLRFHFLNQAWQTTQFWRNQFMWNLTFTRIQNIKRIKTSPYIADVAKHILTIGSGAVPGFRPALDNSLAPIKGIQKTYLEHYELKEYAPIIMQPNFYNFATDTTPVYYSLQFPTALELAPKSSGRSSTISDLYDVRGLLNKYLSQIRHDDLAIQATPLHELAGQIHLDYYHNNVELYEGMKDSIHLLEDDPLFAKAMEEFPDREFPKNSAFVKGAIAISTAKPTTSK